MNEETKAAIERLRKWATDNSTLYGWGELNRDMVTVCKAAERGEKANERIVYLTCAKCKKNTLRYSSTIDGLRCQNCGAAYLNCEQVNAREKYLDERGEADTKRLDWCDRELTIPNNYDDFKSMPIIHGGFRRAIDAVLKREWIDAAMKGKK